MLPGNVSEFCTRDEKYEFEFCRGKDLCFVCRGGYGSSGLAGGHLDGDPRQQLIKQGNTGIILLFAVLHELTRFDFRDYHPG